ncbi:MAG: YodL domain-containing protein [Lachnospiraceae bacterium]|nr:YodL domain-containing protein [Lachnospiraceae bacterium]
MADINGNSRKKVEKLTMEEIADRLEGLKSSLDTIRRTASELIMGIDAQLQELQADKKVSRSLDKQADKEVQLLYGDTSQYGIYQLKDNPELRDLRFAGTAELLKRGILSDDFREIQPENYNLVYTGQFSDIQGQLQGEKLNALFEKFNIDHPADYKGHSLSVSDIVVLHENGKNSAHFVDSFGFTELPNFMHELTGIKEQEADKAENGFTDEEKQFLETDNASLIAKKFLAWDEMEDLGYRFFEDGYIDKFKPVEKALFGNGLVSDDTIHDIAHRMQGGEDIREELAKAFIGGYERVIGVGENDAVAVFGKDAVTVTFENAEKQVSYEEMGTAFLSLIESEYKDIEQARAADEQEEEIVGNATSEHDVNHSALQNDLKLEAEQTVIEQPASEQIQAEQPETQAEQDESTETPKLTDMEDGDEIIDLGDETEQVLADMKKILNDSKNTLGHTDQKREQTEPKKAKETKFAFQIADRFVSIQETESGYDYSIMDMDYKEVEGGVYENTGVDIQVIADDIVDDLREDRFENGAGGSISDDDEIIPIDFDELTESIANAVQDVDTIHKKEAEHIVPDILQGNIVENFKEKTNEFFHEICEMNPSEIEDTVKCHVQAQLDEAGIDAEIVDVAVAGSRCRGLERDGSDLDVVVELSTSEREDVLFDAFNGDALHIGRVKVDINPITAQRTGTLETYLPQVEDYLEGVREAREKEPVSIFNIRMNDEERWFKNTSGLDAEGLCKAYADCDKPFVEMGKYGERIEAADHAYIEQGKRLDFSIEFNEETDQIIVFNGDNFEYKGLRETLFPEQAASEVTLTVAECGEFHNFGEFHEKIVTVDEAVAKWKQIPPERMNGIPAIGINIHTPGTETYNDVITDILSGNQFELDVLDYIPEIKGSPQAMEMIAELIAKLPDMKIEGNISEDLEAKLWEKRMPDLTPAEQLAVEIDRFIYSYDTNAYHDNHQSMTENVSEISEMIGQRDVEYLTEWLNEVISVENVLEKTQRANELLEKLAEYKPLAKIEEMEEQNYNMIDNILNNGAGEKAQKEENKKAQDKNAKPSLKARLAEKKVQVAEQGGDEIVKNQQRGI